MYTSTIRYLEILVSTHVCMRAYARVREKITSFRIVSKKSSTFALEIKKNYCLTKKKGTRL